MELHVYETKEIIDFEKENNLNLIINERSGDITRKGVAKYFCYFDNYSKVISVGNAWDIFGIFGDGNTIDEAITDYCHKISKTTITDNIKNPSKNIIRVPNLLYLKKYNLGALR